MAVRRFILLLLSSFVAWTLAASPVPFFRNFSPTDYQASSQNWALAQDSRGFVYVGNNSGLLRFNGSSWELFHPFGEEKEAIVRSLYADQEEERIYIGSYREFGYLEYDEYGKMVYTSLSQKQETPLNSSEEIWYITRIGRQVFFIYFSSYYVYDLDSGQVSREVGATSFFYMLDGKLHLSPSSGEVRAYDGQSSAYTSATPLKVPDKVVKVFPGKDGSQIAVSQSKGLYRLEKQGAKRADSLRDRWDIANRAIQCKDGTIVVGFLSGGVYAFGQDGSVLWHLSTDEGLLDNTVLALMEDDCGNIWCALDKGAAVIFNGGDQLLSLSEYHLGKISVSLKDGNKLFVGSNQGLSSFSIDEGRMQIKKLADYFPNSQLWSLDKHDSQVFIGENANEYCFRDGRLQSLSSAPGGSALKEFTLQDGSSMLIQGSFTFLYCYKKEAGEWRFSHTVNGFMRPVKQLEVDYLGNIWAEHMYEGIYKIVLSEDGRSLVSETPYFSSGYKVCKIGGRVFFYNKKGFWYYDDRENAMKPYEPLSGLVDNCRKVVPAGGKLYWMVTQNEAVLVSFWNEQIQVLDRVIFKNLGVSLTEQFESILTLSGQRFLFGIENGFLLHTSTPAEESEGKKLALLAITIYDHESSRSVPIASERVVLPNNSSLALSLCSSGFKHLYPDVRFRLDPFDYQPRMADPSLSVSYSHLPAGNYTFSAWLSDDPSVCVSLPVVVKPSFFASPTAYLIYVLLAFILGTVIYLLIQRKLRNQMERMEDEKEKELLTLRNEQLEASILLKSKELATYSLLESSRNRVFLRLKEQLSKIRYEKDGNLSKAEYDNLQSIIREGEFSESSWAHFYDNFDLIHKSFFRTLRHRHPDLTTNDLRICAYLRLNMSTKELADIMGVTPKGAEAAKYRLRKKLSLPSDLSISDYLAAVIPE